MKNRQRFIVSLLLVLFVSQGRAGTKSVAVSFGSPALLGLRGAYQLDNSPWIIEGEYSSQILNHNRSNGRLDSLRLDAQWEPQGWDAVKPFYFGGAAYFGGYFNKYSDRIHLLAGDFGAGLKLPVSERLSISGQFGIIMPTQAVQGFEFIGLIMNLAVSWSWGE